MKLPDIIIFSLAAGFLIIGIHQSMAVGIAESYWLIMLTGVLLLVYYWRKKNALTQPGKSAGESVEKNRPVRNPRKNKSRKR
jgi:hypothetical protein